MLYAGSLIQVGSSAELDAEPLHPHTLGLLLSEPSAESRTGELVAMPGSVPAPDDLAGSCTFAPSVEVGEHESVGIVGESGLG